MTGGFSNDRPSGSYFDYRMDNDGKWAPQIEGAHRCVTAARRIQRAVREWFCQITYRLGRPGLHYSAAKSSFEGLKGR